MLPFSPATTDAPPRVLIIAELGVNHDGSVATAVRLVQAARDAGADAIKLQWFRPARLLSNQARLAAYQTGQADDAAELLARLELDAAAMAQVRDAARAVGLGFVITPFSVDDVPELGPLAPDAIKIASPDAVNPPLIDAAAGLALPLLISTGTCELDELIPVAKRLGRHAPGGALLQCVSSYPTAPEDAALGAIGALRERFGLPVGYSDHTRALETGALAVAAGACVLEKHLTHDRAAPGPDHAASVEPAELQRYVTLARQAATMHGPSVKAVRPCEADVRDVSRQSVAARRDMDAGRPLRREDLTTMRPGTGVPAATLERIVGAVLARPINAGDILTPAHLARPDD